MALRQSGRALARGLMQAKSALPARGGGGGPIKYAAAPESQVPLWDELWWDDGLYHSQPVLEGTLEPQAQSPDATLRQLVVALTLIAGTIYGAKATYSDTNDMHVPQQYPQDVLDTFTSRGKVEWARAP